MNMVINVAIISYAAGAYAKRASRGHPQLLVKVSDSTPEIGNDALQHGFNFGTSYFSRGQTHRFNRTVKSAAIHLRRGRSATVGRVMI